MTLAAKRRWLRFSLITAVLIAIGLAMVIGWSESQFERVPHPETGFTFPEIAEVSSIYLLRFNAPETGSVKAADLPRRHWQGVLGALSPSEYDAHATTWEVLGELRFKLKDGTAIFIALFDTSPSELGAFNAGSEAWHARKYYRGGNSNRLKAAMIKAIQEGSD